jgi:heat shock protein HslJ
MSVENGSIMLETGCNSGSGKITVGEGQVTVGDVATTYMACPGLKMEIERDVFKVWTGETKYVIEGDQLRVTQGQITLVYTPKVMPPD